MLPVAVAAGLLAGGYGLDTAGYAMAFLVGPFAGLVLFGGVLADRFTARRMMIVADLANLAAHVLLALLFFYGIDHLWQLYALLTVAGTANALFQPGAASTVPLVARDVQGPTGCYAPPKRSPGWAARHWPVSSSGSEPPAGS
ncbi:MFS transporter [Catellatospora coxensis]